MSNRGVKRTHRFRIRVVSVAIAAEALGAGGRSAAESRDATTSRTKMNTGQARAARATLFPGPWRSLARFADPCKEPM